MTMDNAVAMVDGDDVTVNEGPFENADDVIYAMDCGHVVPVDVAGPFGEIVAACLANLFDVEVCTVEMTVKQVEPNDPESKVVGRFPAIRRGKANGLIKAALVQAKMMREAVR